MNRKLRLPLVLAALVVVATATGLIIRPLHWRARVIAEKMTGRLPALDWSDLAWMLGPNPSVYLFNMGDPPNPYSAITNPLDAPGDVTAGKHLFEQHCTH